jgi:hypothetical protein
LYLLSAALYLLSSALYLLSAALYLLSAALYLLSAALYLLPIACLLPPFCLLPTWSPLRPAYNLQLCCGNRQRKILLPASFFALDFFRVSGLMNLKYQQECIKL